MTEYDIVNGNLTYSLSRLDLLPLRLSKKSTKYSTVKYNEQNSHPFELDFLRHYVDLFIYTGKFVSCEFNLRFFKKSTYMNFIRNWEIITSAYN